MSAWPSVAKGEAARLEAERRRELAVIAGRAAAQSPLHVSKQKQVWQLLSKEDNRSALLYTRGERLATDPASAPERRLRLR